MISYNIEPHDITTLTAPMFDACGLECPAMIGAPCPGKGHYMDGPADAAHFSKTCPGWSSKFTNAAAEVVHGWTLDSGQSEECGNSVDGDGWWALFRNPDRGTFDGPMGAGVVLNEISTGQVSVTVFDTEEELSAYWAGIVRVVEPGLCEHCGDELGNSDGQLVSVETGEAVCGANPDGDAHEIED